MKIIILYLKKNNPDIALIVLHIDVDVKIFQNIGEKSALVKNQSNNQMYLNNILKEKKDCFVINF